MSKEDINSKALLDTPVSSIEAFDRTVIVISSGAFAVAFAFIDKIVDIREACYNWMFLTALCCFAIPALAGLYNFLREAKAADVAIYLYNKHRESYDTFRKSSNKISDRLRKGQMAFLIAGCILLLLYIYLNTSSFLT